MYFYNHLLCFLNEAKKILNIFLETKNIILTVTHSMPAKILKNYMNRNFWNARKLHNEHEHIFRLIPISEKEMESLFSG
jgi:hypothetical protein